MLYIPDWLIGLLIAAIGAIIVLVGSKLFMSDSVIDYAHKLRNGLILILVGVVVIIFGLSMLL